MTQEVFVRGPEWAVLLHAQVPSKPAIHKRGNWMDSFVDLYNSQHYVHGVMSE